ncbi:putative monooxygenase [Ilyonectria sp. MPI-CAGE-AT-0026]|nr:putative monooxygenase [Ilyonectria sp. MPI-CAGE-AT-0026]
MGSVLVIEEAYVIEEHPINEPRPLRIVVVGAGASGLCFAHASQKHLRNVEVVLYEKNPSIGGTWYENKYPGIGCDIPSHNYQFSWNPNPDWSQFFAGGAEILKYFQDTATRFDLNKYIKLKHKVTGAVWDEDKGKWTVTVENQETGKAFKDYGHFLINGSGFLNNWKLPDIPGISSFKGELLHTAGWKDGTTFEGKTVALIGNGSSGIQILPELQKSAKQVIATIRSATWITPAFAQTHAGPGGANFSYTDEQKKEFRDDETKYTKYQKELESELSAGFALVYKDSEYQGQARALVEQMMRHSIGENKLLADILIPDFGLLCRRPTPGVGYLGALTEKNVRVVMDHVSEIVPEGLKLPSGETIAVDMIICATGYDLSWRPRFPIVGRNDTNLQDLYKDRPVGYLGLAAPDMPNYFVYFGPNSPLAHGSALQSLDHITSYMVRMIHKTQTQGYHSFEPTQKAVSDFVKHADAFFPRTVWGTKCRSWFKGGKEDGPVYALHPGSRAHWFCTMNEPRYEDYSWKRSSDNTFAYLGNGFSLREVEKSDLAWFLGRQEEAYRTVTY